MNNNTENDSQQVNNWEHPFSNEEMRRQQLAYHERFKGGSVTEIPEGYAEKLKTPDEQLSVDAIIHRAAKSILRPQKQFDCALSYEDARVIVWRICKAKSAVINRSFDVDEHNRDIIVNMVKYFIGDESCDWDLNKGLLLLGDVGRGKTYLMSVMKVFADSAKISFRRFNFHTCADIVDQVELDGAEAMQKYYNAKIDICFDDLGQEPITIKRYGNDVNVMERILTKRYSNFINGKCITHITTNLVAEDIEQSYGTRISDRFEEMFNRVYFPGPSRRK